MRRVLTALTIVIALGAMLAPSALGDSPDTTGWTPTPITTPPPANPTPATGTESGYSTQENLDGTTSFSRVTALPPSLPPTLMAWCVFWFDPMKQGVDFYGNITGEGPVLAFGTKYGTLIKSQSHIDCRIRGNTSVIVSLHRSLLTYFISRGYWLPAALDGATDYEVAGLVNTSPYETVWTWHPDDMFSPCYPMTGYSIFYIADDTETLGKYAPTGAVGLSNAIGNSQQASIHCEN